MLATCLAPFRAYEQMEPTEFPKWRRSTAVFFATGGVVGILLIAAAVNQDWAKNGFLVAPLLAAWAFVPDRRSTPINFTFWHTLLIPALFSALWFWLSGTCYVFLWMFFIGDNPHGAYHWTPFFGLALAGLASTVAALRIYRGNAGRTQCQILTAGTILLIGLAAAFFGHRFDLGKKALLWLGSWII